MNSIPEENDLNLSNYQQILFQDKNGDIYKSADIQRKCLAQMLQASCKSLSNENTCNLLDSKLNKYSQTVFLNGGDNIYDNRLKNLLDESNKNISHNFRSNLGNVNVNSIIKPLLCSKSNKNYCAASEAPSEMEFEQFSEAFSQIKPNSSTMSYNSKGRQPFKENILERKYTETHRHNDRTDFSTFRTAKEELLHQNLRKCVNLQGQINIFSSNTVGQQQIQKRKLGTRRNINSKFIPPLLCSNGSNDELKSDEWPSDVDERLKNIEPKMIELIKSEIMDCGPNIHWDDIAGLSFAKTAIQEAVVWPMLRPDIFTGLRRPPKGILLFGPPGTGKTLIGKCVASQSKSTFFSISASSLTSKWIGDGEKMVRALFTVARVHQPAVIFIDEIDSLLSQRSDTEHESSRRIKTEFLVQLDGATTEGDARILVIGATNRPQELDEAARRRFVKKLYIPLPELEDRLQLVSRLILNEKHCLGEADLKEIASLSDGYSGADIKNLCSEASLGPIRSLDMNLIEQIQAAEVRPLMMEDFRNAFKRVKSTVAPKDLEQVVIWDKTYGSG